MGESKILIMNKTETYQTLKKLGFDPEVVVDCGAGWGEWTGFARNLFPNSFIFAIDANPWTNGLIPSANITKIEILSDEDNKEMTFYRKKDNLEKGTFCTGDSLYKENTQHYQNHNTVESIVKTRTLRSIVEEVGKNKIDLLKIDTQGSELLIMKGLGEYLNNVEFVELECSIINYNEGGCNLKDIINFLDKDFEIYEIVELHRHNGFQSQVDIIFKNRKSKIKKIL